MDKKLLAELLEFYRATPYPKWGKLRATLRVNNVKTIAGRKWRHFDNQGIGLLLEIEELTQPKPAKKKKAAKSKEE
jgi:hypothetical protein